MKLPFCATLAGAYDVTTLVSCNGLGKLTKYIPVLLHLTALMIGLFSLNTTILHLLARAKQSLSHSLSSEISAAFLFSGHTCAVLYSDMI